MLRRAWSRSGTTESFRTLGSKSLCDPATFRRPHRAWSRSGTTESFRTLGSKSLRDPATFRRPRRAWSRSGTPESFRILGSKSLRDPATFRRPHRAWSRSGTTESFLDFSRPLRFPVSHRNRTVWCCSGVIPRSRWSAFAGIHAAIFSGHSTARHHGLTRKSSSIRASICRSLSRR